jgi:hypothetical protein
MSTIISIHANHQYTGKQPMTEEQQELYDIVSDWWDKIFIETTKGRSACIIYLVISIIERKNK